MKRSDSDCYYERTTTVTRPSDLVTGNFSVTGASVVCLNSSSAYTLSGAPAGSTVTWTTTNLSSQSGTGATATITPASDGPASIIFNITTACGTATKLKDIWKGKPTSPTLQVDAVDWCSGTNYVASATAPSNLIGPYSFQWYVNGVLSSSTGPVIKSRFNLSDNRIEVRIKNTCDVSGFAMRDGWCPNEMLVYPNPSDDVVSVELAESKSISEIEVIDQTGNVKKKLKYKAGTKKATISIKDLPEAIYSVRVFDGKKWRSEQIIKSK